MAEAKKYFKIVSTYESGRVIEAFLDHETASLETFNVFTTNSLWNLCATSSLLLLEKSESAGQLWYWSGNEIKSKIHPFVTLYWNNGILRVGYLKKIVAQKVDSDSQKWTLRACEFSQQGISEYCLAAHGKVLIGVEKQTLQPNQLWQIEYTESIVADSPDNLTGIQTKDHGLGVKFLRDVTASVQRAKLSYAEIVQIPAEAQKSQCNVESIVSSDELKKAHLLDRDPASENPAEPESAEQSDLEAHQQQIAQSDVAVSTSQGEQETRINQPSDSPLSTEFQAQKNGIELGQQRQLVGSTNTPDQLGLQRLTDFLVQLDAGASGQRSAMFESQFHLRIELQEQHSQTRDEIERKLDKITQQLNKTRDELHWQLEDIRCLQHNQTHLQNNQTRAQFRGLKDQLGGQLQAHRDQMRVMMQQMTELQISQAKAAKKLEQQV